MEVTNIAVLPADLLHLLFEQIASGGDDFSRFSTLFNCIASSKHFANAGAVTALYRICNDAPVKGGGNESLPLSIQGENVQRWAILWRSIILSALGNTMFPYCRHLRLLDLRDLGELLADDKFRTTTVKTFFDGAMSRFHYKLPSLGKGRPPRLDTSRILSAVGDVIIKQAPLLEGLWEPTDSEVLVKSLPDWAPRLVNLRRLVMWNGKAFADETTRNLLHVHCPNLESLGVYLNSSPDADHDLAEFIGGLQPNRLNYFENLNNCRIGPETCLALSNQGQSLRTLKLYFADGAMVNAGLLQGCTALKELSLSSDRPTADLKATQNDTYLEILEWLKHCSELQRVTFYNVVSAPDLVLPLLQNKDVCLESLDINATEDGMYVVKDHRDFHQALGQQQSLQTLHLRADPDPTSRDDIETLINALCSLTSLQDLWLVRISDYFSDEHVKLVTRYLPELRELFVGGYGISDASLSELNNLRNLKNVSFSGITTFTTTGIMDFVEGLGEGNKGLIFAVDNADPDSGITPEEQDLLRDLIQTKVDGRFEYQLLRDPNAPVFESDDSD